MTKSTVASFMASTICGRPSSTLFTCVTLRPFSSNNLQVPEVASILNPSSSSSAARETILFLSSFLTEINAVPSIGRSVPPPIWLLAKAVAKFVSSPITSPVERISGPSIVSTPGKRPNGKTASFTAICSKLGAARLKSESFLPAMIFAAMRAIG